MTTHADFVLAAFAVTTIGMAWLTISSYVGMRKSEARADDLRQQP